VDPLTAGLARELATQRRRVNAQGPGVIDTPLHDRHGKGSATLFAANLPMRRAGTAGEMANASICLLPDVASCITGSILNVSGGR